MTVRIMLSVALIGMCTWAGRSAAMVQVRRIRFLDAVLKEMEMLKNRMLLQRLPLGEAFLHSNWSVFSEMGKEMGEDDALHAWGIVFGKRVCGADIACIEEEELHALEAFFSQLGSSGVREQETLFEGTRTELEKIRQGAGKVCSEKMRLYTALGALTGAALVIMLF